MRKIAIDKIVSFTLQLTLEEMLEIEEALERCDPDSPLRATISQLVEEEGLGRPIEIADFTRDGDGVQIIEVPVLQDRAEEEAASPATEAAPTGEEMSDEEMMAILQSAGKPPPPPKPAPQKIPVGAGAKGGSKTMKQATKTPVKTQVKTENNGQPTDKRRARVLKRLRIVAKEQTLDDLWRYFAEDYSKQQLHHSLQALIEDGLVEQVKRGTYQAADV